MSEFLEQPQWVFPSANTALRWRDPWEMWIGDSYHSTEKGIVVLSYIPRYFGFRSTVLLRSGAAYRMSRGLASVWAHSVIRRQPLFILSPTIPVGTQLGRSKINQDSSPFPFLHLPRSSTISLSLLNTRRLPLPHIRHCPPTDASILLRLFISLTTRHKIIFLKNV